MTKTSLRTAIALAGWLLLGGAVSSASAAVLTTALMSQTGGGITCVALNSSARDLEVEIELVSPVGALLASFSSNVPGGHTFSLGRPEDIGYCRFTFRGGKNSLRGTACYSLNGGCTAYLEAR